jgi:hypothetical protein
MGKNEMTTPTQAQIEAAAKAIHDFEFRRGYVTQEWSGADNDPIFRDMATIALTAAAQVGDTSRDPRWVGLAGQGVQIEFELRKELLTIEARTIERCAQVAEAWEVWGEKIAAAIRELKKEGK